MGWQQTPNYALAKFLCVFHEDIWESMACEAIYSTWKKNDIFLPKNILTVFFIYFSFTSNNINYIQQLQFYKDKHLWNYRNVSTFLQEYQVQ